VPEIRTRDPRILVDGKHVVANQCADSLAFVDLALAAETLSVVRAVATQVVGNMPRLCVPALCRRRFAEPARAVVPSFQLTARNAEAVAAIRDRLDGIPLAIELAAVRVRTLLPAELAVRLDDRFEPLTAAERDASPGQQTLCYRRRM